MPCQRLALPRTHAGTDRFVNVHRFGTPNARPKVYIQAGLHADEMPSVLVAHYLCRRLNTLHTKGRIAGEVVLLPLANPIGLDQTVLGKPSGRFALADGRNFNRDFPDLATLSAPELTGRLTGDARSDVSLVRNALRQALSTWPAKDEADDLRKTLLGLAIDADIVLDLHCDSVAPVHLYLGTPLWPDAEDLAREVGAQVTLLADESGGMPFDEACSTPWWRLSGLMTRPTNLPPACLAATVEYRGTADVDDALAQADAERLLRFLTRRAVITGDPGPMPPLPAPATPLAGVDMIRAPVAGLVVYRVSLGDRVSAGQIIAEIIDPSAADPDTARTPVRTGTDGPVWSLASHAWAHAGSIVAKVAGSEPLPAKGTHLLTAR